MAPAKHGCTSSEASKAVRAAYHCACCFSCTARHRFRFLHGRLHRCHLRGGSGQFSSSRRGQSSGHRLRLQHVSIARGCAVPVNCRCRSIARGCSFQFSCRCRCPSSSHCVRLQHVGQEHRRFCRFCCRRLAPPWDGCASASSGAAAFALRPAATPCPHPAVAATASVARRAA